MLLSPLILSDISHTVLRKPWLIFTSVNREDKREHVLYESTRDNQIAHCMRPQTLHGDCAVDGRKIFLSVVSIYKSVAMTKLQLFEITAAASETRPTSPPSSILCCLQLTSWRQEMCVEREVAEAVQLETAGQIYGLYTSASSWYHTF